MLRSTATRHISLAALVGVFLAAVTGCALTGVSRSQEVQLGQQTAAQVNAQHRTWTDPTVTELGQRLAAVSERPDYPYTFRVIEDRSINAFSLPGGPVYLNSGLLDAIRGDRGEVAGVLAHEIAHVARRHAAQQIERKAWLGLGITILTGGSSTAQAAATLAANLEELGYSRNQEREADTYGAVYMVRAGMDPQGLVRLLQFLTQKGAGSGGFLSNHPGGPERVTRIQTQIESGEIQRLASER